MLPVDAFLRLFLDEVEGRLESLRDSINSGRCANWETYRERVGEIRGLVSAAQLARELVDPMLDKGHPLKPKRDNEKGSSAPRRAFD